MPVNYGSLPFDEQISYFRSKTNISTERWADVWQGAHDRSFMVAGAMKTDLLADFRGAVDKAISEGKSLGWFKSQFNSIVAKHGWQHKGEANWRSQVIYETNLRQSYTAGREQQIEQIKGRRPYGIYKHSGSEHPRHDHLTWNNLVVPLDDPWWQTHTPTNGYGCKCKKLTASQRTLDRLGLTVTGPPKVDYYEWVDKVTGEVHKLPQGIDPGFDYTPKSSAQLTNKTKAILNSKPALEQRLTPRSVDHAYSSVKGVSAQRISQVLDELDSPELALFSQALHKHNLKTLVLKQTELSGGAKARAIATDVEAYLQSGRPHPVALYMTRRPTRTNGFTSARWQHVVVKAKATANLSKVSAQHITQGIELALKQKHLKPVWSMSSAAEALHGHSARVLTTWAHEMGHQIHMKGGRPSPPVSTALTQYAATNDNEWFAEHFVAWLFAPAQLKAEYPEIFNFITDTAKKAA
ncbi:phage minor head protein [Vibrio nomapromontoriensis]|uniref:phage minor head protein n=1 Tax=Vibrio nomapromontoriensis TaxID=2910246 RepID=UPI003D0CA5F5